MDGSILTYAPGYGKLLTVLVLKCVRSTPLRVSDKRKINSDTHTHTHTHTHARTHARTQENNKMGEWSHACVIAMFFTTNI